METLRLIRLTVTGRPNSRSLAGNRRGLRLVTSARIYPSVVNWCDLLVHSSLRMCVESTYEESSAMTWSVVIVTSVSVWRCLGIGPITKVVQSSCSSSRVAFNAKRMDSECCKTSVAFAGVGASAVIPELVFYVSCTARGRGTAERMFSRMV